jgi:hypothetical protein
MHPASPPTEPPPPTPSVVRHDLGEDADDRVPIDLVVLVDLDRPAGRVAVPWLITPYGSLTVGSYRNRLTWSFVASRAHTLPSRTK